MSQVGELLEDELLEDELLSNPKSITPVTLFKRHTAKNDVLIYGFNLENEYFLVGYGLDGENDLKRNQKYITGIVAED